ncbi:MAG: hypothetical protein A2Y17_00200 [Clostridiales bacterium GWF2_38_85]|nr:MAG: hypothetical protein A2Y17_00200 [Clostridiales bacterium GWF2_38_85]HBL83881.1 NUDIX hydrolase [Clostridiales bacterium]
MNDYIYEIRKLIGHSTLMCTACGVIIENENNEILLQKRADNKKWGLPGGSMNIGEKFVENARREVFEETGLIVDNLTLFGIFSGEDRIIEYPNKDVCYVTDIIFRTKTYKGELLQKTDETEAHKFFSKNRLPDNISVFDFKIIKLWKKGCKEIVVD